MTEPDDLTGMHWRKSSYSGGGHDCVEIAFTNNVVGIRDSKSSTGPVLMFTPGEWDAFTAGVRAGEFNNPTT